MDEVMHHTTDKGRRAGGQPTIVYIAGSGRSGSTLVERAIGAAPGFVNVGEVLDLFRQALAHDERCGCGEPLTDCVFWGAVIARAEVLSDPDRVRRMSDLQRSVIRQRHLPRMLVPALWGDGFGAAVREYAEGYAQTFAAVAAVSGATYVVDASKWPVQALALATGGGLDVRVIQVIRDPRGVAYSQSKSEVTRPQGREGATMAHQPALSAAARWTASQSQIDLLRARGLPAGVVHYEDFVTDPAASVRAGLAEVGIAVGTADLGHLRPGQADLPMSHGISGNPSRFTLGEVALRADEDWRTALSRPQQAAVVALASPHLPRLRRTSRRPVAHQGAPL